MKTKARNDAGSYKDGNNKTRAYHNKTKVAKKPKSRKKRKKNSRDKIRMISTDAAHSWVFITFFFESVGGSKNIVFMLHWHVQDIPMIELMNSTKL